MASGKVHIMWWKIMLPVALLFAGISMFYSFWFGILFIFGYLLGYICDPDLDQIGLSSAEGRAMRKFGFLGVIWIMFWLPYAYIFKHRSFWTHSFGISTLIRVIYLFGIPAYIIYEKYNPEITANIVLYIFGVIFGLMFSDTIHLVLDK